LTAPPAGKNPSPSATPPPTPASRPATRRPGRPGDGYGTKLPELAAAPNDPQISITLAGKIDSLHQKGTEGSRIRNTFSLVPDAPVERFVLELKGGKKGLLVDSTDVCKGTHKALAAFAGQNGKLDEYEPALKA
jgi:hypothetical protein